MSKRVQWALIGAFVVVDLVLVVGAWRHVNATPDEDPALVSAPASADPTGAPTTAAPTPDSSQLEYDFKASDAVALSTANDGTVVYGTRGRCGGAAVPVMVSTNGGTDFAAQQTGFTSTLAVKAGPSTITVVGTDGSCDVRQVASTDGGNTWTQSDDVDLWYPAPDEATEVVSPARSSVPAESCVVTSVSQVTDSVARVSCADGTFFGSGDEGKTWVELGRLDNVRVSAFLTPGSGVALARYNGCGANQFSTDDGGVTWTPGGCITGDPAQAIAATSNGLTAVVADEVYASADGATWTQP